MYWIAARLDNTARPRSRHRRGRAAQFLEGAIMRKIVILGAGTAGTIMANRLRKTYKRQIRQGQMGITVVDQNDDHVYQPGLLFVPFGMYKPEDIVRSRKRYLPDDVEYQQSEILRVEPAEDKVYLGDGQTLDYDLLIVATGA
jgi:sulfide:quinone oxidoreductase